MKTKLATALSVAGVLSAGSAAALVNTQILDGGPVESTASAALLPTTPTVDVTIPELAIDTSVAPTSTTTETTVSLAPVTTLSAPAAPSTTQPAAPAAPSMLTAFNVGDAGVVTVDVIDGRVMLVDSQSKAGWTVTSAVDQPAENRVQVEFRSSTVRVNFEATLVDGQIVPSVSSKSIAGTTSPAPAPGGSNDDDHDDDDHDDHDDDDHDDDDHDDHDDHDDDDHDDDDHDDDEDRDDD